MLALRFLALNIKDSPLILGDCVLSIDCFRGIGKTINASGAHNVVPEFAYIILLLISVIDLTVRSIECSYRTFCIDIFQSIIVLVVRNVFICRY